MDPDAQKVDFCRVVARDGFPRGPKGSQGLHRHYRGRMVVLIWDYTQGQF